jgi:hypothetical protein
VSKASRQRGLFSRRCGSPPDSMTRRAAKLAQSARTLRCDRSVPRNAASNSVAKRRTMFKVVNPRSSGSTICRACSISLSDWVALLSFVHLLRHLREAWVGNKQVFLRVVMPLCTDLYCPLEECCAHVIVASVGNVKVHRNDWR